MLLSSHGTSRASSEHDVHRRMELSPGAHRSPAQEEMSPLPAAQPGADGRLSPRLLLSGGSVQLAHADTLLFQFAFWPAINISKNSCRDGFLFSFPFFFFFLNPLCKTDIHLSCIQVLVSHFPVFSMASVQILWGNSLHFVLPQTIPRSPELLRVTVRWTLLLIPGEMLLRPRWVALGSPSSGWEWKALSTGCFSIKMRKKPMEASTDRLCAAEEAPMGSL